MNTADLFIGTSGYDYDHWSGGFYPKDLAHDEWFDHYAQHFRTVEINNTYYNLPEPKTFRDWKSRAPEGFVYAVKASRYMTHMKKLKDPREPWQNFWNGVRKLGDRLGPILFQLPPHWRCNPERLETFLKLLPRSVQPAFEFRDPDWYNDTVYGLLEDAGAALVRHDMEGSATPEDARTGGFGYYRFHGSEGAYEGRYGKNRLRPWARRIRNDIEDGRRVYVYFNNDQNTYAVRDAVALREMIEQ